MIITDGSYQVRFSTAISMEVTSRVVESLSISKQGHFSRQCSSMPLSNRPTVTFKSWCQSQRDYAKAELQPRTVLRFDINPPSTSCWDLDVQMNTMGRTTTQQLTLDRTVASKLLRAAIYAFQTESVEPMIAALIHSFGQEFKDQPLPTISTVGRGQERWNNSLDISRTVGWLSMIFPAQMSRDSQDQGDILDAIRERKDCLHRLPQKRWSYLISPERRGYPHLSSKFTHGNCLRLPRTIPKSGGRPSAYIAESVERPATSEH
ncbi:hypothetical protein BKA64DRAFT_769957 [Cadophora sp. MPI-SDFR-AT-0126]|nr:hypothetical protein BKA64DRAFT_769957 [Leotiomycetes sp. MPI-SDFR-AT-0126]